MLAKQEHTRRRDRTSRTLTRRPEIAPHMMAIKIMTATGPIIIATEI